VHAYEKHDPEDCSWQETKEVTHTWKSVAMACAISIVFTAVLGQILAPQPLTYGADDASTKIAQADEAVTQAFIAVADAQQAGANVSTLLARLNEANAVLAEAHTDFRNIDYVTASQKADQAFNEVQGIAGDAESLKRNAESDSNGRLVWTASLSSVGLILFSVACLLGWRLLKRRYMKQALETRPEKVDQT